MSERDFLAEEFEANRSRLRSAAFRMLGSRSEAEDAVQEAWLRLARADGQTIANLSGWLTTVVARVCLDILRSRKARHEEPIGYEAEMVASDEDAVRDSELADSVGVAMLVVLEALAPAERVAFVLHDMFNLPFDDIAPILGRSSAAARQLASRARRRLQGAPATQDQDRARQREVVGAFLAAARGGDFTALLAVLDPDVVLHADALAVASATLAGPGAPPLAAEVRGAEAVANIFNERARAARVALVGGNVGFVFAPGGSVQAAFEVFIDNGRIIEINVVADPSAITALAPAGLG